MSCAFPSWTDARLTYFGALGLDVLGENDNPARSFRTLVSRTKAVEDVAYAVAAGPLVLGFREGRLAT